MCVNAIKNKPAAGCQELRLKVIRYENWKDYQKTLRFFHPRHQIQAVHRAASFHPCDSPLVYTNSPWLRQYYNIKETANADFNRIVRKKQEFFLKLWRKRKKKCIAFQNTFLFYDEWWWLVECIEGNDKYQYDSCDDKDPFQTKNVFADCILWMDHSAGSILLFHVRSPHLSVLVVIENELFLCKYYIIKFLEKGKDYINVMQNLEFLRFS